MIGTFLRDPRLLEKGYSLPEFVDLLLNATSEIDQAIEQEENGEDESDED
jgi:hypothetical protein